MIVKNQRFPLGFECVQLVNKPKIYDENMSSGESMWVCNERTVSTQNNNIIWEIKVDLFRPLSDSITSIYLQYVEE